MKKSMMTMLSLMLVVPMMAQYGRPRPSYHRPHVRPVPSSYRGYSSYRSAPNPIDVYFGFRVGANLGTVNSDDKYLNGGDLRTGLNAGVVVGFPLAYGAPVYLETGLYYMEKGGKGKYNNSKFTYSLNYLEVPLVIKYDIPVNDILSIQPFAGGYLAAGIDGKIKDFGQRAGYNSFDDDGFKRFDGGIRAGCGVQVSHFYAEMGYDFGLANISRDTFDTTRTGTAFATLGVNF